MANNFKHSVAVIFSMTDLAGILYFSRLFELYHQVYEEFVKSSTVTWEQWFQNPQWAIPLRTIKADYLIPMKAGQDFDVYLSVSKLGNTSYALIAEFKQGSKTFATVEGTHVVIDKKSHSPQKLPDAIRLVLNSIS